MRVSNEMRDSWCGLNTILPFGYDTPSHCRHMSPGKTILRSLSSRSRLGRDPGRGLL
jgi:hypothetical protein